MNNVLSFLYVDHNKIHNTKLIQFLYYIRPQHVGNIKPEVLNSTNSWNITLDQLHCCITKKPTDIQYHLDNRINQQYDPDIVIDIMLLIFTDIDDSILINSILQGQTVYDLTAKQRKKIYVHCCYLNEVKVGNLNIECKPAKINGNFVIDYSSGGIKTTEDSWPIHIAYRLTDGFQSMVHYDRKRLIPGVHLIATYHTGGANLFNSAVKKVLCHSFYNTIQISPISSMVIEDYVFNYLYCYYINTTTGSYIFIAMWKMKDGWHDVYVSYTKIDNNIKYKYKSNFDADNPGLYKLLDNMFSSKKEYETIKLALKLEKDTITDIYFNVMYFTNIHIYRLQDIKHLPHILHEQTIEL